MDKITIIWMLAGFLLWPALEYAMHAGLGHLFLRGKTHFSRQHTRHHAEKDWFAPHAEKALAAAPAFSFIFIVGFFTIGWINALALTFGFASMYLIYEIAHLRAHTHPPKGPYGRWLRKNHFSHHFQNPRKNHGVTSPFFDYLFGTHVNPGKVIVPERFALTWLLDPATGDVWKYLANDYELKRPSTSAKGKEKEKGIDQDVEAALKSEAPCF